jgi:hypothetical protein
MIKIIIMYEIRDSMSHDLEVLDNAENFIGFG